MLDEIAGIFDPNLYFQKDISLTTISDSINLDREFIKKKMAEGFDPKILKTFLIGGCRSEGSVKAMLDFIAEMNPGGEVKLIIDDINEKALNLININKINTPPNIKIEMLQGDLTNFGAKVESSSIDYVRMDYTQNFISQNQQQALLKELSRVLSDHGIVSSMLHIMPKAKNILQKLERFQEKGIGSRVDLLSTDRYGYDHFVPSEEFIGSLARKLGLKVSYFDKTKDPKHRQEKLAIFEKQVKKNNFSPL